MQTSILKVEIEFIEPILGSSCNNPEVHQEFIASKAPTKDMADEETEALQADEMMEKAVTVFPVDSTGCFIWNYQVKGFIKRAVANLIELGDIKTVSKWACKKVVDNYVFVNPRRCYLLGPTGKPIKEVTETMTRPLRADTMKGERIALATSQILPAGTQLKFQVEILESANPKAKLLVAQNIIDAIHLGSRNGLGQWRSAGYGSFTAKISEPVVTN